MEEGEGMNEHIQCKEAGMNLVEAIRNIEDKEEQQKVALSMAVLVIHLFTSSSYEALGAFEAMKRSFMDVQESLYSKE